MIDILDPVIERLIKKCGMTVSEYVDAVEMYCPVVHNLTGDSRKGYIVEFRDASGNLPNMAIYFNPTGKGVLTVDYNWYQLDSQDNREEVLRYLLSNDDEVWAMVSDKAVHYLSEEGLLDPMTPGWKLYDRGERVAASDKKKPKWKFKPLIILRRK